MRIQLEVVLSACIVNFACATLLSASQLANEVDRTTKLRANPFEMFQNLFDSIAKNERGESGRYREVLKQEVAKGQAAYETLGEDLVMARRGRNYYKNVDRRETIVARKRETAEAWTGIKATTPIWKDVFDAALSNDIDSVKYFLEVAGEPVTTINDDEKTIAHIAAEFGRLSILRYILDKNASLLKRTDIFGYTVLHRAVEFGDLDVVKFLVDERGADVYQPILHSPGNSAFHLAAQNGKFDIVEYFVTKKFVNVNLRNRLGETALFSAAETPYMRIIQYLIEECHADTALLDSNQDNILYKCGRRGDVMLPKYLFHKRNLTYDVNWINVNGYTALNLASKYNKVGFINFMIQQNASIFIPDKLKRTPLHFAAERGYYQMCKLLVEHGADYNVEDANGVTPLQLATDQKMKTFFFMNAMKTHPSRHPQYKIASAGIISNVVVEQHFTAKTRPPLGSSASVTTVAGNTTKSTKAVKKTPAKPSRRERRKALFDRMVKVLGENDEKKMAQLIVDPDSFYRNMNTCFEASFDTYLTFCLPSLGGGERYFKHLLSTACDVEWLNTEKICEMVRHTCQPRLFGEYGTDDE